MGRYIIGGWGRIRTGVHGFAGRCITPLPPSLQTGTVANLIQLATATNWSGKRDSNSRPQPWQGCALPTELFPQILTFSSLLYFATFLSSTFLVSLRNTAFGIHAKSVRRAKASLSLLTGSPELFPHITYNRI